MKVLVLLVIVVILSQGALAAVTNYYYSGSRLIATDVGSTREYFVQDRLGSNRVVYGTDGAVRGKFTSLPFGATAEDTTSERFDFTGKEKDSTGLYYFGARYYDDNVGKFLTTDPVDDGHDYAYVNNNPMNYVDPDGQAGQSNWMIFGGLSQGGSELTNTRSDSSQGFIGARHQVNNMFSASARGTVGTQDFSQKGVYHSDLTGQGHDVSGSTTTAGGAVSVTAEKQGNVNLVATASAGISVGKGEAGPGTIFVDGPGNNDRYDTINPAPMQSQNKHAGLSASASYPGDFGRDGGSTMQGEVTGSVSGYEQKNTGEFEPTEDSGYVFGVGVSGQKQVGDFTFGLGVDAAIENGQKPDVTGNAQATLKLSDDWRVSTSYNQNINKNSGGISFSFAWTP